MASGHLGSRSRRVSGALDLGRRPLSRQPAYALPCAGTPTSMFGGAEAGSGRRAATLATKSRSCKGGSSVIENPGSGSDSGFFARPDAVPERHEARSAQTRQPGRPVPGIRLRVGVELVEEPISNQPDPVTSSHAWRWVLDESSKRFERRRLRTREFVVTRTSKPVGSGTSTM